MSARRRAWAERNRLTRAGVSLPIAETIAPFAVAQRDRRYLRSWRARASQGVPGGQETTRPQVDT